jgi:hypothetical protein
MVATGKNNEIVATRESERERERERDGDHKTSVYVSGRRKREQRS